MNGSSSIARWEGEDEEVEHSRRTKVIIVVGRMRMREEEAVPKIRDGEAVVVPKRREDGSKMKKTIVVPNRIEEEEEEMVLKWRWWCLREEAIARVRREMACEGERKVCQAMPTVTCYPR